MRILSKLVRKINSRKHLVDGLFLVSDGAGWILDEVAEQIATRMPTEANAMVDTSSQWTRARKSIIHFIERSWAWHKGHIDNAHVSNHLIGLWWHGTVSSDDQAIQFGLEQVSVLHPRFAKLQVPTSIARDTLLGLGVPEDKLVYLPEGLDTSRFVPDESGAQRNRVRELLDIPQDTLVIGSFQKDGIGWNEGSNPKLIKGPDVFADAMEILNQRHPIFVLMPGPARGYLQKRLSEAGVLHSNPGYITHKDGLAELYHALDLYVSPSRDEGGPAGVMEAMASRIPVVSTRSGIAVDIFGEDKNGLLVAIEDAEALAAACERLLGDEKLRSQIALNGYQAIQFYDWSLLSEQYFDQLYRPLLNA